LETKWKQLADQYCDNRGVNILVSHLLLMRNGGDVPEEPESERSIIHVGGAQAVFTENIPNGIQYVALGHLHRLQTIDTVPCPVVYSGSPLSYSMSEAGQEKCVLLLDAEPGKPIRSEKLPLASGLKLERKRFTDVPSAIDWLQQNPDTIVELTLETENYLTADERRQIAAAHPRIIGPIPFVKNTDTAETEDKEAIRLDDDLTTLFKNYFRSRYNQEPNDELMAQFAEVLNVEEED
jgi:exonuclease SbcD